MFYKYTLYQHINIHISTIYIYKIINFIFHVYIFNYRNFLQYDSYSYSIAIRFLFYSCSLPILFYSYSYSYSIPILFLFLFDSSILFLFLFYSILDLGLPTKQWQSTLLSLDENNSLLKQIKEAFMYFIQGVSYKQIKESFMYFIQGVSYKQIKESFMYFIQGVS